MKNSTPAVLWYSQDFITGTADMTMEERGAYVTLLSFQNIHGHMSADFIKRICPNCPEYVLQKFVVDEEGNYYNKRMEDEIKRRVKYSESRKANRNSDSQQHMSEHMNEHMSQHMSEHMNEHMETETETVTVTNKDKKKESEEKEKKVSATAESVISHLNLRTGKRYRANTQQTKARIQARMNEGYQLSDFMRVIDVKATEWMGTDMEKYLRPETLFGPKFEAYLNQRDARRELSNVELAQMLDEAERRSHEQSPSWADAGESVGCLPEYLPGNG